ncbi:MAG: hypothetical protein HZB55_15320 [Deltaproteobacteria bacterium]|nr:hypothetical protein [Deltaproteobacteria bacterium]
MAGKSRFILMAAAVLTGMFVYAFGQTTASSPTPWLDPRNPTRLEWLALEKQATEGNNEFGENGVTVNFYLGPDSYRTGEILCDLAYLPSTSAQLVQMIEDGIQKRFEMKRSVDPWARVKITKKVAKR